MRLILIVILIAVAFYWLSGKGIVTFDNTRAKSCINDIQNRLAGLDPEGVVGNASGTGAGNVNYEVNKLCVELRDLSERALRLRKKLLANVVESTSPERTSMSRTGYGSRR